MRAQATGAGLRSWIDEAAGTRVRRRIAEVVALGVVELLVLRDRYDHVVDGRGAQAGGVDERVGGDGGGFAGGRVLDFDFPACAAGGVAEGRDVDDGGVEGDGTTGIFE